LRGAEQRSADMLVFRDVYETAETEIVEQT
jgi:hypothetical protein